MPERRLIDPQNFSVELKVIAQALTKWMVIPRGVKVLSENTRYDENFRNDELDSELVPVSIDGLSEEFRDLLQIN